MAKKIKWRDEYWLLLLQVYLQKPVGVKPMYCRRMVDLSMELHVSPATLHSKMSEIANLQTPRIERFMKAYGENPRKLSRAVRLFREMNGFHNAGLFYEGVETNESFEKDFKPVAEGEKMTPVMLVLILDLYFRLTPITMVAETPEVQQLARLIKLTPKEVVAVLGLFQYCDPYLRRKDTPSSPLLEPCQQVWRLYGNGNTEELVAYADELRAYFK